METGLRQSLVFAFMLVAVEIAVTFLIFIFQVVTKDTIHLPPP
jgi:hypothetical protein